MAVRGERCGKGTTEVSGGDREGERERIAVDVPLSVRWHQNRGVDPIPGGVWRVPDTGQAVSGMEATRARSAACAGNVGRRTAPALPLGGVGQRWGLPAVAGALADRLVVAVKPL